MGKKPDPIADLRDSLEKHLSELELEGANAVRAELARTLVEGIAETPAYALPRLAQALMRLLGELEHGPEPVLERANMDWLQAAA